MHNNTDSVYQYDEVYMKSLIDSKFGNHENRIICTNLRPASKTQTPVEMTLRDHPAHKHVSSLYIDLNKTIDKAQVLCNIEQLENFSAP